MMNGKQTLFLDQYGGRYWAKSTKELKEQLSGSVSKMYVDKIAGEHAGKTVHCGYIVGDNWLNAYRHVEVVE